MLIQINTKEKSIDAVDLNLWLNAIEFNKYTYINNLAWIFLKIISPNVKNVVIELF